MQLKTSNRRRHQGSVLVLVLFLLPVLIIMIGVTVDLAHMLRVRAQMQATTDLAAKSGAIVLSQSQDTAAAIAAVQEIASLNEVAGQGLTIPSGDIVFGRSVEQPDGSWQFTAGAEPYNSLRVTGSRDQNSPDGPVGSIFGRFFNHSHYEPTVSATAAFLDIDICLVLDRSSSMKLDVDSTAGGMGTRNPRFCMAPVSTSRWAALDGAMDQFIARVDGSIAGERVAIVSFATNYNSICGESNLKVTLDQGLTENTTLLNNAMDTRMTTVWNGGTDIRAGIEKATEVLTGPDARSFAKKVMIVFTDGVSTTGDPVAEAQNAANEDITVMTITFGSGANQTDMINVANVGNGQHYHATDAASLNQAFLDVVATLEFLVD